MPFVVLWTCLLCGMQIWQHHMEVRLLAGFVVTLGAAGMVSYFTRGSMGMGDSFLFAMTVMGMGIVRSCYMFVYCFTGAFLAAVLLVTLFHKGRDCRIPLAPFILAASVLVMLQ